MFKTHTNILKQGAALTGCNRTGPPCTVGRPTAHAHGSQPGGGRPRARPAGSVTDDDRHQRAKQSWPIRRASNEPCRHGHVTMTLLLAVNCIKHRTVIPYNISLTYTVLDIATLP